MKNLTNCSRCGEVIWSGKLCDECRSKLDAGISRVGRVSPHLKELLLSGGIQHNIEDGINLGGRSWHIK